MSSQPNSTLPSRHCSLTASRRRRVSFGRDRPTVAVPQLADGTVEQNEPGDCTAGVPQPPTGDAPAPSVGQLSTGGAGGVKVVPNTVLRSGHLQSQHLVQRAYLDADAEGRSTTLNSKRPSTLPTSCCDANTQTTT